MGNVSREDVLAGFRNIVEGTENNAVHSNASAKSNSPAEHSVHQSASSSINKQTASQPLHNKTAQQKQINPGQQDFVGNVVNNSKSVTEAAADAKEETETTSTDTEQCNNKECVTEQNISKATGKSSGNLHGSNSDNPVTQTMDALNSVSIPELLGLLLAIFGILNAIHGSDLTLSALAMVLAVLLHVIGQIHFTKTLELGNSRTSGNKENSEKLKEESEDNSEE